MKGFQLEIKGNWGHFKRPETNNNPLTFDFLHKTAFVGMMGAVLGIERKQMKSLFPRLSDDLLYGVQLLSSVKKVSLGFTSKKAVKPTDAGSPKYFEFLKNPAFKICVALKDPKSEKEFDEFKEMVKNSQAVYTPILGIHNCNADLNFLNEGEFEDIQNGCFETKGFVVARKYQLKNLEGGFRIGFDKVPTYQNDDFYNPPDRFVEVVYPDYPNSLSVEGDFYEYKFGDQIEKWCLI